MRITLQNTNSVTNHRLFYYTLGLYGATIRFFLPEGSPDVLCIWMASFWMKIIEICTLAFTFYGECANRAASFQILAK